MKIDIDIQELQQLTQAAIEDAEKRRKKKLAQAKAKEEREAKAALHKAEGIIAQIPDRCAREAEQGRNHAIIMGLSYSDVNLSLPHLNRSSPALRPAYEKLKSAAAIHVWNACEEAKLNPTLEEWHDGGGMKGGYNIVVHWKKKQA